MHLSGYLFILKKSVINFIDIFHCLTIDRQTDRQRYIIHPLKSSTTPAKIWFSKVKYFEVNNKIKLHITNGACNQHKFSKSFQIMQNSLYCASNSVEITWYILQNQSFIWHRMVIITWILNIFTFLKMFVNFFSS
jgi:hypothetical protein